MSVRTALRRVGAGLSVALVLGALLTACSGEDDTGSGDPPTRAAVAAMLTRHAAAVRAGDRTAFLADVAPGAYRNRQQTVFGNLLRLPLRTWSYSLGVPVDDAAEQKRVRKARGSSALVVRVALRYAFAGADAVPTEHDLWLTVVNRSGRPALVADTDLAEAGGRSWQGPWDFGPVTVLTGPSVLVVAHPDDADVARSLVAKVGPAVAAVTAVVGRNWPRTVAVVVPSSTAEREAALGTTAASGVEVGAIATSDGDDPVTGRPLGQRVVVDPDEYRRLNDRGVGIVLRHEITHVAVARDTTGGTPRWLAEGFAEYVGQLGTGQPVSAAARELRALVARSGVPDGLPAESDFDSAGTAAVAYQRAWLACRLIADVAGQPGLVRFYRAVGASPDDADTAVAAALRSVVRETPTQFLARYRTYVAAQLR